MNDPTRLGQLIREWRLTERFPPNDAQLAKAIGVSRQTVANWSTAVRRLPEVENLRALSRLLRVPYPVILDAALRDAGYLASEELGAGGTARTVTVIPHDDLDGVSDETVTAVRKR